MAGSVPARAQLRSVPLRGGADPLDVARALSRDASPAFLHGAWLGGGAILASNPIAVAAGAGQSLLAALDAQPAVDRAGAPSDAVGGGFLGGLGYASLDESPPQAADAAPPPGRFGFHDHLLRHDGSRWTFEMLWTRGRASALEAALDRARELVAATAAPAPRAVLSQVRPPDEATHLRAVAAAQDLIARGGMYQASICAELTARLDGAPIDLWRQLVQTLLPSHAAYITTARGISVGASPELFLRRVGDLVATAPIKGTRPRSPDPVRDAAARSELADSAKDRAENVMIVDLMRNDLGRVARIGGVRVAALLQVIAGAGVWHLVSRVEAQLREGAGDAELLRAAFPPGSVTGAPKIAARAAIARLEQRPRRLYTGAVGILSPTQGLELAVVIRTFEIDAGAPHRARLGIGGGITEGSDPQAEYAECLHKAAPLLQAAQKSPANP